MIRYDERLVRCGTVAYSKLTDAISRANVKKQFGSQWRRKRERGLCMTFRGGKGNLAYVLNTRLTPGIVDRGIMNTN